MAETCARCGHVARGTCPTCGKADPFLGASIWLPEGKKQFCHTFSGTEPSCYMLDSWDRARMRGTAWTTVEF